MRGRPRIWCVSKRASTADQLMWRLLFARYGSRSTPTRIRVVREFRSWLNLNGLPPRSGLQMYVGSLINSGMKIGSVKTYVGYVLMAHPFLATAPTWVSVFATVQKAHADALVREARRICWADFHLLTARIADEPMRIAITMMGVCGLRLADLQKLRRSQIIVEIDEIRIRVRISKGRRCASKAKLFD